MPSWSSSTGERSPIAWLSATLSVETTSSFGAPFGGRDSQALRSGSMRWQKPQLGRQKSTSILLPRKSERFTVWPERSGKLKSEVGSPILGPVGGGGRCRGRSRGRRTATGLVCRVHVRRVASPSHRQGLEG